MANYRRKRRKAKRLRQQGLTFRADLHMHTTRSDGIHAPEDVLEACGAGKLDLVAITDHDIGPEAEPGWHCRADHRFTFFMELKYPACMRAKSTICWCIFLRPFHRLFSSSLVILCAPCALCCSCCSLRSCDRATSCSAKSASRAAPLCTAHCLLRMKLRAVAGAHFTRTHLARGLLRCGVVRAVAF